MSSLRHQRVRELLKREIGEVIRRELPVEETGLITVTDVGMANDLKAATVYVGVLGTAEQQRKGLAAVRRHRARIQELISRQVILKYTPRLHFVLDRSIERGQRVLQIIEDLERDQPET